MTNERLDQIQTILTDILVAFRPEILAAHGKIDEELKGDNSPVTELDKKLERQLREALVAFDPSIPVIGEEYGGEADGSTFWLIDPIDGTESFIRGLPYVRNMVALIENDQPMFTVVYMPVTDDTYIAVRGKGAYKNGVAIHASKRPLSRTAIDIIAPQYIGNLANALQGKIQSFKRINEFTYVAEGKIDAVLYCSQRSGPWDHAPRGLLLQEAGLKVATIGSTVFDYRSGNFLAANPEVFDVLMETVTSVISFTDTSS